MDPNCGQLCQISVPKEKEKALLNDFTKKERKEKRKKRRKSNGITIYKGRQNLSNQQSKKKTAGDQQLGLRVKRRERCHWSLVRSEP